MHHFGATASTLLNQGIMIESPVKSLDLTLTHLRTASLKMGWAILGLKRRSLQRKRKNKWAVGPHHLSNFVSVKRELDTASWLIHLFSFHFMCSTLFEDGLSPFKDGLKFEKDSSLNN